MTELQRALMDKYKIHAGEDFYIVYKDLVNGHTKNQRVNSQIYHFDGDGEVCNSKGQREISVLGGLLADHFDIEKVNSHPKKKRNNNSIVRPTNLEYYADELKELVRLKTAESVSKTVIVSKAFTEFLQRHSEEAYKPYMNGEEVVDWLLQEHQKNPIRISMNTYTLLYKLAVNGYGNVPISTLMNKSTQERLLHKGGVDPYMKIEEILKKYEIISCRANV